MTAVEAVTAKTAAARRILIVDDDRDFADSLRNFLMLEGYDVECAYAADQVDFSQDSFAPDAAILDYRLGATIGLDLIAPLTARNPNIVCLLSTAYSDIDTAVKALRAGIHDYFIKPLDTEMFLATLNRCFEMIDLKAEAAQAERLRREAKRHEAVAQVVGGVAHHFNNLFAVIQGNLELLAEQAAGDGHQLDFMDNALEAIDEAASINQNLVAYVSLQALTPEPLDIGVFLADNREPLEHALAGDIRLELRIDQSLWAIRADRGQFMAALECLMHNASDAMTEDGLVTITARNIEAAGEVGDGRGKPSRHVLITVSDTGEGVAEDIIGRVFEPFFTKHGMALATGLGLSRVSGFAKQSGGFVTIENNPRGGASVLLYMPVVEDDPGVVVTTQ